MADAAIELLQFPYSHFNEKARWALDYKRVPHRRINYLPGPHALPIMRLTGQTEVPVLRQGKDAVHGSARIIDLLEQRFPDPPLYPSDASERKRALEIQTHFDEEVGPRVRRGLFAVLLEQPGYVADTFAVNRGAAKRALYRAAFPLVTPVMKKGMGIAGQASIDDAVAGTERALDFVAAEAGGPDGHLVGDAFSVADLAAAALLAPAVMPEGSPMFLPEPRPRGLVGWLERWAPHPGAEWVRAQYRVHRPASADTGGSGY